MFLGNPGFTVFRAQKQIKGELQKLKRKEILMFFPCMIF